MLNIEKTGEIIIFTNLILFIALIYFIGKWQSKFGKLSERKTALIIILFFTIAAISTTLPLVIYDYRAVIVDIILILFLWTFGYWLARWVYRNISKPK
jgi:predicted Na+-dependent transporter